MLLLRGWPTGSLTWYQLIARRTSPSSSSQGCASKLRAAKRLFETVDGCTGGGKSCRFARAFLLEVLGPVSWCGALQFAPGAESFFGSSFSLLWLTSSLRICALIELAIENLVSWSLAQPWKIWTFALWQFPFEDLCTCSSRLRGSPFDLQFALCAVVFGSSISVRALRGSSIADCSR